MGHCAQITLSINAVESIVQHAFFCLEKYDYSAGIHSNILKMANDEEGKYVSSCLSVFLWKRVFQFSLSMSNQKDPNVLFHRMTENTFSP